MKCLGCQTSFKEGEKLMMEDLKVEYKNYNLPIREEKGRRILTKTIVSFLNSKGGTIYIGVEDNKGEVRGVELYEEDKADFTKFLKQLVSKIRPEISVGSDSFINHYFIPILSKRGFENKYVVKIHVQQGDTARLYCFVHELSLIADNQEQRHQILCSYFRHNMGGVEELRGVPLLTEARNRSLNPRQPVPKANHLCNPQPLVPQEAPSNVLIMGVSCVEQKEIQSFFRENLAELGIKFTPNYRADRQTLLLTFSETAQFEKTNSILKESLDYLNQIHSKYAFTIESLSPKQTNLVKTDKFGTPKKEKEESKNQTDIRIDEKTSMASRAQPKAQEKTPHRPKISEGKQRLQRKEKNYSKQIQARPLDIPKGQKTSQNSKQENVSKVPKLNFSKRFSITFTYLDKSRIDNLMQFLQIFNSEGRMEFIKYDNTLQVFLESSQQRESMYLALMDHHLQLKQFGFKGKCILWGKNQGILIIKNYDSAKRYDMQKYLTGLMKEELTDIQFMKTGKKGFAGVCVLKNNEKACIWLDRLLCNYEFKNRFGLNGSKQGNAPKMTIKLYLQNSFSDLLENSLEYGL